MAKDKTVTAAPMVTMTEAEYRAKVAAEAAAIVRNAAKAEKTAKATIAVARRTPGLHVLPLLSADVERNTLAHVLNVLPGVGRLTVTIRQTMTAAGTIDVECVYGANPARFRSGDVATASDAETVARRMMALAKAKAEHAATMMDAAVTAYNAKAAGHVFNVKAKAEAEAVDGE